MTMRGITLSFLSSVAVLACVSCCPRQPVRPTPLNVQREHLTKFTGSVTIAGAPKAGALVHLENAPGDAAEKLDPVIVDIVDGKLTRPFIVVQINQPLIVRWEMPGQHDIHISSTANPPHGRNIKGPATEELTTFRKPDLRASLVCSFDVTIRGDVSIVGNKHYVFTDRDGRFTIELPAGQGALNVVAYYPSHHPQRQSVERHFAGELKFSLK